MYDNVCCFRKLTTIIVTKRAKGDDIVNGTRATQTSSTCSNNGILNENAQIPHTGTRR